MAGQIILTGTKLDVDDLKALSKAFRQLEDRTEAKSLREALKRAADIVADDARARVPRGSGTQRGRRAVHAADTIGSAVSGANVYIVGGKKQLPYYGWLDFGSRSPQSGRPRTVGPWSGSGKGPEKGRFIYPAIAAKIDEVGRELEKHINQAIQQAGLG